MKLIIREYLSMLRESKEFDAILPDLLFSMDIIPLTKPQIGVRQAGVDVAAIGPDENGIKTLWLFVLKRGDLGRRDWNGEPQSIRPSLDEIKDVYLRSHVNKDHCQFPVKIVVATTGDRKQEVEQDWAGYSHDNTIPDKRSYDLWNGDHIAALIEEHLLNEHALPFPQRANLRRALALIGETEYELEHYYALLTSLLQIDEQKTESDRVVIKKCLRTLRTTTLALGILCNWACNEENLRNGLLAAERTLLWTWNMLRKQKLNDNKKVMASYIRLIEIYLSYGATYFNKLQSHYQTKEGISRYYREAPLLNERVFEEIGLLSLFCTSHYFWGIVVKSEEHKKGALAVAESLHALIENHGCSGSPCYDGQIIDISLALVSLHACGKEDFAKSWLRELISRLTYTYRVGNWFPIATDSFDDLVDFESGEYDKDVTKLQETSWLVPTLAQWAAVLMEDEAYELLVGLQKNTLQHTCLQIWHPDEKTDASLFQGQALYESGISEAPIRLPDTAEEMREYIRQSRKESPIKEPFHSSAQMAGILFLDFIANRHFRVPIDPAFWQNLCIGQDIDTSSSDSNDSE